MCSYQVPASEPSQAVEIWQEMDDIDKGLRGKSMPTFFSSIANRALIPKLPRYTQKPVFDAFVRDVVKPAMDAYQGAGGAGVFAATPNPTQ